MTTVQTETLAPNVPLLRATLRDIELNPADWNQASFRSCFAYRAMVLSAEPMKWLSDDPNMPGYVCLEALPSESSRKGWVHAEDRAMRVLGITLDQSDDLFAANNTLDDLREIVGYLTDGMDPTYHEDGAR